MPCERCVRRPASEGRRMRPGMRISAVLSALAMLPPAGGSLQPTDLIIAKEAPSHAGGGTTYDAMLAGFGFDAVAPASQLRFIPKTFEQYRTALFAIWNMLDRNIYASAMGNPLTPGTPYGYMRYVQLEAYSRAVWELKGSPTYCEIGFNGGHSVAAMLLAHPRMKAISFELGDRPYTAEAVRQLRLYFGADRLDYHVGDSKITVPAYASTPGYSMCDVILVDGDHTKEGAYIDVVNMNTLAKPGAPLFIDDINEGPGKALNRSEGEGIVNSVSRLQYWKLSSENPCTRRVRLHRSRNKRKNGLWHCNPKWGFATARYLRSAEAARDVLKVHVNASSSASNASKICANGIRQFAVCCAASCGACDSEGCSQRTGGTTKCCPQKIYKAHWKSHNYCSDSKDVACIINVAQGI